MVLLSLYPLPLNVDWTKQFIILSRMRQKWCYVILRLSHKWANFCQALPCYHFLWGEPSHSIIGYTSITGRGPQKKEQRPPVRQFTSQCSPKILFIFYWVLVDLQCCCTENRFNFCWKEKWFNFCCTEKWFGYTYFFRILFHYGPS